MTIVLLFVLALGWSIWYWSFQWASNLAYEPACAEENTCGQFGTGASSTVAELPQANQNGYEGWEMLCNFTDGVTNMHCANGLDYTETFPSQ